MKTRLSFMWAMVFFVFLSETVRAIESPVGSGRLPPQSTRSGLVRSPNPIDTSGNLVVTGNITSGKYFRGIVPYRTSSDFGAVSGSSSLDSFLRDSAGSEDFGRFSGGYRPYYSQTGTVAIIRPGSSNVFRPPTAKIDDRTTYFKSAEGMQALGKGNILSGRDIPVSARTSRPMSMTIQELERVFLSEVSRYSRDEKSIPASGVEQHRSEQLKQFQSELKQISSKVAKLKQNLEKKPDEEVLRGLEEKGSAEQRSGEGQQGDVYRQMQKRPDKPQKGFESWDIKAMELNERAARDGTGASEKDSEPEGSQAERLTEVSLSAAKAERILGGHKSIASFAEERFNQHLEAAEDYLKQGRYYRAADAYTLALIYKPEDPIAYAGKGHALFAAGEYMSSALFLSRALEIFPEYLQLKVDIEAIIGDRDKLESRAADVEQWLEKNSAPELKFLLAYVYYRMNRFESAVDAIEAAYEQMPESTAVVALKKAIYERKGGN